MNFNGNMNFHVERIPNADVPMTPDAETLRILREQNEIPPLKPEIDIWSEIPPIGMDTGIETDIMIPELGSAPWEDTSGNSSSVSYATAQDKTDDKGQSISGDAKTEKPSENPSDGDAQNHAGEEDQHEADQGSHTVSCDLDGESNDEGKELTEDEINERQRAAIKEALERIRNGEKLTNEELGNLGEMMMDQYYISKGYKPLNKHRVTSLEDKKGGFKTGIDGVYENINPDGTPKYIIVDAKYNTSQLSETNDGKQMSDNWIDKRLDDAVGKEKADEIRDVAEDDPDSVKHEVYHIDPNIDEAGCMHTDTQEVDSEGNKCGEKTIAEYFDENGERVEPSNKTEERA